MSAKPPNRSFSLVREIASRPTNVVLALSFLMQTIAVGDARLFGLPGETGNIATYLAFAPTLPKRHLFLPWIFSALVHVNWWHFISNAPWFWFVGRQLGKTVSRRAWLVSFFAGVIAINLALVILRSKLGMAENDLVLGLSAITLTLGLEALILRPRLSLVAFFALFGIILLSDPTLFGSPLGAVGHGAGLVIGLAWGLAARAARPKSPAVG